ncbi:MAG: DUF58 domain-containing protein [Alphaproteobacteria bacterium]
MSTVVSEEQCDRRSAVVSRIGLLDWPGLAAVVAAMIAAAWLDQRPAVLLAGSILAIGLVGRAWAALSLLALRHERRIGADRGFPGDRIELHASLDNRKPLPLSWVTVEEPVAPGLAVDGEGGPVTVSLGMYQRAGWRRSLHCVRRGYYPVGPSILRSGDIFGLFATERAGAAPASVIVYPRLYDLAELGLPSRHPLGTQRDPSRLFEDFSRPYGLRDYTPDTPFKAIAWAATARRGTLQVRAVEPTATLHAAILLAVEGFEGPDREADFEFAAGVAASLAMRLLDERQPTGLFANGRRMDCGGDIAVPPGCGDAQRRLLLDRLGVVEPVPALALAELLDRHAASLPRGASICVLAARLDEDAVLRLRQLALRGYAVQLLWLGEDAAPGGLPVRRLSRPDGREAA